MQAEKTFLWSLGLKVRDRVTGFEGTVTGRANYITGCNSYMVAPPVDKEGKFVDAHWFDEHRLEIVEAERTSIPSGVAPG